MKNIVISLCTYRRPEGLKALFESFKSLQIPDSVNLSARVIDNEPTPAARELVQQLAQDLSFSMHYVHEPEAGIAPARNRALTEAKDADYLVFIDDDETAAPDWIEKLWDVQNRTKAHFVQGPVILTVEDQADQWWIDSLLFRLKTFPDCSPRHESWSNNVMIDMDFVRKNNLRFDPALRFDGGEDTLFFQQMTRAGGKGVFAAHAKVYEVQPKERLNWRWALRRQFRNGNTRGMCARRLQILPKAITHTLFRSTTCAGLSIVLLPTALIKGKTGLANAATYAARSLGMLWGLIGKRTLEYARQENPETRSPA